MVNLKLVINNIKCIYFTPIRCFGNFMFHYLLIYIAVISSITISITIISHRLVTLSVIKGIPSASELASAAAFKHITDGVTEELSEDTLIFMNSGSNNDGSVVYGSFVVPKLAAGSERALKVGAKVASPSSFRWSRLRTTSIGNVSSSLPLFM